MRRRFSGPPGYLWRGIFLSGWIVHLALIWTKRTPPSLDYAHWLHQANVLAHYGAPGFDFERWYTIAGWFIPNGGFTLPAALLAAILPLEAAGKVILSLYCIFFPLSVRYMMRSFGNNSETWMISILLLFNISFVYGNIAFLAGCPLLFFSIGLLEKMEWPVRSSHRLALTLCSAVLSIAHAVCAMAFLLYLALKAFTSWPKLTGWHLLWGGLIVLLAVVYLATRPSDETFARFAWGMDPRTRFSLLAKSFAAGVTFPPFEFSLVRFAATSLMALLVAAMFLTAIVNAASSFRARPEMPAYMFFLLACALFAPKYFLGAGEVSQRLIFIAFFCALALLQTPPHWNARLAAALAIAALLVIPVRSVEYARSSALLDARREFIEQTVPPSEPLMTFDDDLGASGVPFAYLIPKGITFIFQEDYQLAHGGYDPLSYRTGYIVPRNDFFRTIDSLARLRKEPGFLSVRGSEIPDDVGYVVLDFSSDFGKAMEARLAPAFRPVARKEIAPGMTTEILRRQ